MMSTDNLPLEPEVVGFTIVQSDGRVVSYGATLDLPPLPEGGVFLTAVAPGLDHYWDGADFAVIPPSPGAFFQFDYATKTWIDPRTLDDLKTAKWAEVKRWRADATVAPQLVTRFGVFDGDAAGVDNIKSTVLGLREAAAIGAAPSTITWTLYDNSTVELTPNELSEVAAMLLARGNVAHERARVLRLQIEAATTAAELGAVVW